MGYAQSEVGKDRSVWLQWKVHEEESQENYKLRLEPNHKQPEGQNEKFIKKLVNLYYSMKMESPNTYDPHV